jgi:hypothetical protein
LVSHAAFQAGKTSLIAGRSEAAWTANQSRNAIEGGLRTTTLVGRRPISPARLPFAEGETPSTPPPPANAAPRLDKCHWHFVCQTIKRSN